MKKMPSHNIINMLSTRKVGPCCALDYTTDLFLPDAIEKIDIFSIIENLFHMLWNGLFARSNLGLVK